MSSAQEKRFSDAAIARAVCLHTVADAIMISSRSGNLKSTCEAIQYWEENLSASYGLDPGAPRAGGFAQLVRIERDPFWIEWTRHRARLYTVPHEDHAAA